ncbi:DUF3054 domain-containing protein [Corynebacterium heidelbergense]|nr:DUF3054 domain-containing protein [Corynebacterium heidelbergense]
MTMGPNPGHSQHHPTTGSDRAAARSQNRTRPQRSAGASAHHPAPGIALVADLIAVALFALLARIAHNSPEMPLSVLGWVNTAWPFMLGTLLGWGILWFSGARGRSGFDLSSAATIWAATLVTGLVIWGIGNHRIPHWSFIVVAGVMSALLLLGWRLGASLLRRIR